MFTYSLLNLKKEKSNDYLLKAIEFSHINKIKILRNNNIKLLRQSKKIDTKNQYNYFFSKVKSSTLKKKPNLIIFCFFYKKKFIGYGGYVNINWINKSAEISYLSISEVSNLKKNHKEVFSIFLKLVKNIAKKILNLKTLYSETYSIRKNHIKILENSGFTFVKKKLNKKNSISLIHKLIL